ncbi:MAG: ATP-binding protein [Desulfuromonadaceae bacterium]|nr:ATP-binding protein [Desulfuromonadaceae bacterium]
MDQDIAISNYKKLTVNHPYLKLAINRLGLAIRQARKGNIVFMFGPTGVGKSTLASHMKNIINSEFQGGGGYDRSILPAEVVEAPYSDAQKFSWKDFYRRALTVLHDPLAHKKVNDPRCSAFEWKARTDKGAPGYELRLAFENAIKNRKLRVLLFDEAHHIAKGASESELKGQLEYLKSLANLTETVIVLVGTYDLLSFRNLSGQLSRRSFDVHFPRYQINDKDEYHCFGGVVKSFASKLPIQCDFKMTDIIEDLYVGSLGCVGTLNDWIIKAIEVAVAEGNGVLKKKDLITSMFSYDQMSKMIDEVLEGEKLLIQPVNSLELLKTRLGISGEGSAKICDNNKEQPKKFIPFKRKPMRDSVGVVS